MRTNSAINAPDGAPDGVESKGCSRQAVAASAVGCFVVVAITSTVAVLASGVLDDAPRPEAPAADRACSVYCNGALLRAVQLAGIFNDSKEFVDMPMRAEPEDILNAFARLPADASAATIREFVNIHFDPVGSDVEDWIPSDWSASPSLLARITNDTMRRWAGDVHAIWRTLGRRALPSVAQQPQRHSMLPLPHPTVVPGGRFRESYYWDSYWVILGLLASDMGDTARGLALNLVHFVNTYGLVPNGGRVYYLTRSQPPLLSDMVVAVANATPADQRLPFLRNCVSAMHAEYAAWTAPPHAVTIANPAGGEPLSLSRYYARSSVPRPESFVEDTHTAQGLPPSERALLWRGLASAAETGWDFSSRWFSDARTLRTTAAQRVVPTDLNSLLVRYAFNLATVHRVLGDDARASQLEAEAHARARAMHALMWSEQSACWRDLWLPPDSDTSTAPRESARGSHPVQAQTPTLAAEHSVDRGVGDVPSEHEGSPGWVSVDTLQRRLQAQADAWMARVRTAGATLEPPGPEPRDAEPTAPTTLWAHGGGWSAGQWAGAGGDARRDSSSASRAAAIADLATRSVAASAWAAEAHSSSSAVSDDQTRPHASLRAVPATALGQVVFRAEPSGAHANISYASDYFPLWAGLHTLLTQEQRARLVDGLKASQLLQVAGLSTSTRATAQQWDHPDAWAPLQWVVVEGLRAMGDQDARQLAASIALRWLHTNLVAYQRTGFMFEKCACPLAHGGLTYSRCLVSDNATAVGMGGAGGEYVPQTGFGWTNGVALHLIETYFTD